MSEKKEEKSTWDELVGELGVNVTDDALERRQPPSKELPTRRRENVEQAQATPSDWEGLASSLGIDVPSVVEEQPVKKPTAIQDEEPAPTEPRTEPKPREEEPKATVDSQRVDSSEFVEQTDESDEAPDEAPPISGEAARSAFDALFAADAASWGSAFVSARTNVESSFLFTEGEEAVFTEDISDDSGNEDEEEEKEKKKGRRRRRRGGRGRGRGGAKTGVDAEEENKEDADRDEQSESVGEDATDADSESSKERAAPEKRRRRRRSRGRSRSKDEQELTSGEEASRIAQRVASQLGEDEDDLEEDLLDDDDSPSTGGRRASHRNLPTWDEAIGVIVDTNLAQRSKSPSRHNSGSSRGRGRGGRRHKKS